MDMSSVTGVINWEGRTKAAMYKAIGEKHQAIGRCFSPFVAVADGGLTICRNIGFFGEAIFKSIGNMFGSVFTKKLSFKKGVTQLSSVGVGAASVALSPLHATARGVGVFGGMLLSPSGYAEWQVYDPDDTVAFVMGFFLHPVRTVQHTIGRV